MARYLITGGAGFIGSHLVDALAQQHSVTVIDTAPTPQGVSSRVRWYQRSITADLQDIFAQGSFDGVFHLAAIPSVQYSIEHPEETNKVNYEGTENVLKQCKEYHVPRFVLSSSAAIYGDHASMPLSETLSPRPLSPYAEQKLRSEELCRAFAREGALTTVALRYFNVYGPRQSAASDYASVIPRFIERSLQGKPLFVYGDGLQTRDFISVFDIVAANIAAMESANPGVSGQTINIGSGSAITIRELAQTIAHLTGTSGEILYQPPRQEPRQSCADISKARALLSWNPKLSLSEGLQKTLDFYKTNK